MPKQTLLNLSCGLCLKIFHLLARKPNLEKNYIYSNKFFHNFHLSEYSFSCSWLQASGLARRLDYSFLPNTITDWNSLPPAIISKVEFAEELVYTFDEIIEV